MKLVVSSAAKSKLGGLFCNVQDGTIIYLILNEMGHPQTEAMSIYVDNRTAVGIDNSSIKKQRSRITNISYFGVVDQVTLNNF